MYVPSEKAIPATSEISFDVFGYDYAEYMLAILLNGYCSCGSH
jgi:hypothetical protein